MKSKTNTFTKLSINENFTLWSASLPASKSVNMLLINSHRSFLISLADM